MSRQRCFAEYGSRSRRKNRDSAAAIFDADPNQIWNRLEHCLLVRQSSDGQEYGADEVDPLLWPLTKHLLSGQSHEKALACLDEFLRTHAERTVSDALKRAILQHDLWAVFDWAAARGGDLAEERSALEIRVAEIIRRLSLTPKQIRQLPDTYARALADHSFAALYDPQNPRRPFLPPDLFCTDGPWVCISAYSQEPTVLVHFSGRSRFLAFINLPGGRAVTDAYMRALKSSREPPLVTGDSGQTVLNLRLPQFPAGTQVALVQQAMLIDSKGKLAPTMLTESVQLRVYHSVTPGRQWINYFNGPSYRDQDFLEFHMSRRELFAGRDGGLRAIGSDEVGYPTFMTHGMDFFEEAKPIAPGPIMRGCGACHGDSGIHSVQSRLQFMKHSGRAALQGGTHNEIDPVAWETAETISRKLQQSNFKLLQSMWRNAPN